LDKRLHAKQFDGLTFGMSIDTTTEAYKNFKKALKYESCVNCFGDGEVIERVIPFKALGAIMREAHWLVTERHDFDYVKIDGFKDNIYVKYSDKQIDFSQRMNW